MTCGGSSCDYLTFSDAYMLTKCYICKKTECICDIKNEEKKQTCTQKVLRGLLYPFKGYIDKIYSTACYNLDVNTLEKTSYPIFIGAIVDAIIGNKYGIISINRK